MRRHGVGAGWRDEVLLLFDEYMEGRLRPLLRSATAICGDPSLAEDLVQDVLLKVQLRWSRVSQADNVDAYVQRMLVNEFVSWRRRWARIEPRADAGEALPASADVATAVIERSGLQEQIGRLPRKQQVVLALRYYEGMSDAEIAQTMNCAESTVRAYASRALATLRTRNAGEVTEAGKR